MPGPQRGVLLLNHDNTFDVGRVPAAAIKLIAAVARQVQGTGTQNVINIFSPAALLEVHDNFFHHNSAVMMPDCDPEAREDPVMPTFPEDRPYMTDLNKSRPEQIKRFREVRPSAAEDDGDKRISGLGVLVAAYRFQRLNPDYKLLLAGHCDTSGDANYNFQLSELRAKNVLHLALGERSAWVEISMQRSKVEDTQRILKHYARAFGWDCDPGDIDNQPSDSTTQAVANFQSTYNDLLNHSIAVDGVVGRETWGAFFDVYMEELAQMLHVKSDQLNGERTVTFLDDNARFIACGEKNPIDQPDRADFRSKENRRVEFLFFHKSFPPDLSCHRSTVPFCMQSVPKSECGVYGPDRFEYVHLLPKPLQGRVVGEYIPKFEVRPSDQDLTRLPDPSNDSFNGSMAASAVGAEDPWAFLEPFAALEPHEGSDEVLQTDEKE